MSQHETAGGARANYVAAVLRGIRQKVQVVPHEFHCELPVAFQEAWHPAAFMVRAVDVDAVVLEHFHRRPGYLREDIPGRAAGEVGDFAAGRRVWPNVEPFPPGPRRKALRGKFRQFAVSVDAERLLDHPAGQIAAQQPVGQARQGSAQLADALDVLDGAHAELQPIAFDELGLGPDDVRADVGARAQRAKIALFHELPQLCGGNFLPGLHLLVVKPVQFREEETRLVHDRPAAVAVGAVHHDLAGRAFGSIFVFGNIHLSQKLILLSYCFELSASSFEPHGLHVT